MFVKQGQKLLALIEYLVYSTFYGLKQFGGFVEIFVWRIPMIAIGQTTD